MENFKTIISKRRKELKMTQRELAEKINVSDKTISKWENGGSYPEITLLSTIAKVLQIDVTSLLGANDMSEKEVNKDEEEVYDDKKISKFKTLVIISIGLIIIGIIVSLFSEGNKYIITLGIIFFLSGIILYIITVVNFRGFYKNKFFRKEYDITYYKYSLLFIQLFLLPIFTLNLYISKGTIGLTIDSISGLVFFIIILVMLFIVFKGSLIRPKKDKLNIIMFVLFIIIVLLSNIYSLRYLTFFGYITLLIFLLRYQYIEK